MIADFSKHLLAAALTLALAAPVAHAATCSDTGGGYDAWKPAMAAEAKAAGIGSAGIAALMDTSYATATIRADRGQKSFKLTLDAFMEKRGSATIVKRGRKLLASNRALFDGIEKTYGVPPGPLVAIWGMESAFGAASGTQDTLSAVATLAYDCRRSAYFTDQLLAALKLVDKGVLSGASRGAAHGEVGQTQFLPKSVLLYGADGDGNGTIDLNGKADALASTAKFLIEKGGWQPGAGYKEGEPNFTAIKEWNAATVYQQAIAIMGAQIDGQ